MADKEIGAFLNINPDVLSRLESFDNKLESIEKHAHDAADALKKGFGGVQLDTSSLERAITQLASKIEGLGGAQSTIQGLGNAIQGVATESKGAVGAIGGIVSNLSKTAQIVDQISYARPFKEWNIPRLEEAIKMFNEMLRGEDGGGIPEQQEIVNKINLLKDELKIQKASIGEQLTLTQKLSTQRNADANAQQKALQEQQEIEENAVQESLKRLEERSKKERELNRAAVADGTTKLDAWKKLQKEKERRQKREEDALQKSLKRLEERSKEERELNRAAVADGTAELEAWKKRHREKERIRQREEEKTRKENERIRREREKAQKERQRAIEKELRELQKEKEKRQKIEEDALQKSLKRLEERSKRERELNRAAVADGTTKLDAWKKTNKWKLQARKKQQEESFFKSPENVLLLSSNARTLKDHKLAIEYLKKARLYLNTTDLNYKNNLNQINQALRTHNQELNRAGVGTQTLVSNQRRLLDISGQLMRQLALAFSVSQIKHYVEEIARVRGIFEIEQRSLEAIVQNKQKGQQLFSQVTELAVKSPFQVRELLSYVKQLAAYRIETDKLFNTTKRLADVSAGLGVGMERIILAYGQVKSAAYLRGTEVRQFTEAGINIYGELQRYYQEIRGEAYNTAQIVDMISKRKVTFEDIEQIFKRMTSEGGIFYNMQEIQAETLQGKISNLKDSFDLMLNSFGKENEGLLKGTINLTKALADNWRIVLGVAVAAVGAFSAIALHSKYASSSLAKTIEAAKASQSALDVGGFRKKINTMKTAIASLGVTIKGVLSTIGRGLAGSAFFMLLDGIITAVGNSNQKAENIRKIIEEREKENAIVNKIAISYKKLEMAKEEENKEDDSIFKQKKEKLRELYNIYADRQIEIPVMLASVTEDNIDKVFNDAQRKLLEIKDLTSDTQAFVEKNKANFSIWGWTPFSNSITEETTDFTNAVADLAQYRKQIELLTSIVANNYDKLDSYGVKNFERLQELSNAFKENEISNYEFISNAHLELSMLYYKLPFSAQMEITKNGFDAITKSVENFEQSTISARRKWEKLFTYMNNSYDLIEKLKSGEMSAKDFEVVLDEVAIKQEFSEKARYAFKNFALVWAERMGVKGLTFEIKKEDIADEMEGINKIFKEWFATHKYRLDISYDDLGGEGFRGLLDEGKAKAQAYKTAKESADALRRAKKAFFNQKQSGLDIDQWNRFFGIPTTQVSREQLIKVYTELARANRQAAIDAGWTEEDPDKKEKDVWTQRISILKEMNAQYEKLKKVMGETDALDVTREAFREAFDSTGMNEIFSIEEVLPTKEGLILALEKLLSVIPERIKRAGVKTGLEKEIAELKIGIDSELLEAKLSKIKQDVKNLFDGLDLHDKLKEAGLSEREVLALFPNISQTLDDVERGIHKNFDLLRDSNGELGEKTQKEYEESLRNLSEQRIKEQRNLVVELTKSYKTHISEQLQLDMWYYRERSKIYSKVYDEQSKSFKYLLTPEMQKQYDENLKLEYEKKTSQNIWNAFKGTDTYVNMFDNLEVMSTKAIGNMVSKLQTLREQMKSLDPTQLKEVMEFYNNMEKVLRERNPFKHIAKSLKAIRENKKQGWTENKLIQDNAERDRQNISLEQDLAMLNRILYLKYEAKDISEEDAQFIKKHNELYNKEESQLRNIFKTKKDTIKANKTEISNNNEKLKHYENLRESLEASLNLLSEIQQMGQKAFGSIADLLQTCGEESEDLSVVLTNLGGTIVDMVLQAIMFSLQLQIAKESAKALGVAMNTAMGVIGWIVMAIQLIVELITTIVNMNDKKIQDKIKAQKESIEKLAKAYEKLKTAMDNAWSIDKLELYKQKSEENLNAQIEGQKALISAERERKASKQDKDAIKDAHEKIEELKKQKEELNEELKTALGGMAEDEYRSAAQDFVDVWYDAFKETGDGLDALKENFNDFFVNVLKKQAMMRIADKFLDPIFRTLDSYLIDNRIEASEVQDLMSLMEETAPEFNEALKNFFESMGIFGASDENKSELSALTQSIQGITESTAEALESLLNSIRFFVAQQTSDISAIRSLLSARQDMENSKLNITPMMVELKAQTDYLEIISDRINKVFTQSATSKGAGLRVYLQN